MIMRIVRIAAAESGEVTADATCVGLDAESCGLYHDGDLFSYQNLFAALFYFSRKNEGA